MCVSNDQFRSPNLKDKKTTFVWFYVVHNNRKSSEMYTKRLQFIPVTCRLSFYLADVGTTVTNRMHFKTISNCYFCKRRYLNADNS